MHTNPSRKWRFSTTLFKPEEFEGSMMTLNARRITLFLRILRFFPDEAGYFHFSDDFSLKLFLRIFLDYSYDIFVFYYLVSGRYSNFGARLHDISCRNVISIEHTASRCHFLLFFGQFCHLEKGRILCGYVKNNK